MGNKPHSSFAVLLLTTLLDLFLSSDFSLKSVVLPSNFLYSFFFMNFQPSVVLFSDLFFSFSILACNFLDPLLWICTTFFFVSIFFSSCIHFVLLPTAVDHAAHSSIGLFHDCYYDFHWTCFQWHDFNIFYISHTTVIFFSQCSIFHQESDNICSYHDRFSQITFIGWCCWSSFGGSRAILIQLFSFYWLFVFALFLSWVCSSAISVTYL